MAINRRNHWCGLALGATQCGRTSGCSGDGDVPCHGPAAFNLEFAKADRSDNPTCRRQRQQALNGQVTFEVSSDLGGIDHSCSRKIAARGDFKCAAVHQRGFDRPS